MAARSFYSALDVIRIKANDLIVEALIAGSHSSIFHEKTNQLKALLADNDTSLHELFGRKQETS